MGLTADNLRVPNGPITQVLFPGKTIEEVDDDLLGYIERAKSDSRVANEPDAARKTPITKALALSFVFSDIFIRLNAEPLNVNLTDKGGHGYSMEQIQNFEVLAEKYLDEAVALLTPISTSASAKLNYAAPNIFTW